MLATAHVPFLIIRTQVLHCSRSVFNEALHHMVARVIFTLTCKRNTENEYSPRKSYRKHKHQHYLVQRLRLRLPASSQMILWVYIVDPITASVALRIARLGRDPHVVACCRPCAYGRRTRYLRRVQGPVSPLRQNICSGARRQSAAYCAVSLLT